MRFLADENFPGAAVVALATAGHDVAWVRTAAPGCDDAEVLAWAVREQRILLTFDKDFGEVAARSPMPATCGIVLVRMPPPKSKEATRRLVNLISARNNWTGHFTDAGRIGPDATRRGISHAREILRTQGNRRRCARYRRKRAAPASRAM
jgi:predicted nuclease of predicted toxin-antitoxin system